MQGQIDYYNDERGYGFIKAIDGNSYFFHVTAANEKYVNVLVGDSVEFDGRKADRGLQAVDVVFQNRSNADGHTPARRRRTKSYTPDFRGEYVRLESEELQAAMSEISNWKLEAKLEDLVKYFLAVPEVEEIQNGQKSYVIGRKGTGKTAIVSHLSNIKRPGLFVDKLSFKNFPFNELYKLNNSQYTKPNQYITLWKYIIYSTVVRMMANMPKIDPLLRGKIRRVYPETDASDLKGLLRKWTGGDFSISVLGTGFSFANWLSRKTDTTWVERVDRLEKFILANADSSVYLVLFDELDEDYKEMLTKFVDGGYIHLLTSLFKAVQDIRGTMGKGGKRVFPVVFLRDDIFSLITDSDKNKWRDLTTYLEWSLPEIRNLLKHRIEKASGKTGSDFFQVWHSIFENESIPYSAGNKSLHSLDYITRSTHGRPRDFIHYLQVCADSQLAIGGGRITTKTVINADKSYSNYLRDELTDEIHGIIPDIINVFRALSQIRKWILTTDEFSEVFDNYVERGVLQTKDSVFVLQTLFYFSVIGNVSRNRHIHIFRHEHPESVLNFHENIVIHRGLMKALQIL